MYRKSAERIKEMQDRIRSLEQEVQDWKRQAELWKSMCASPPPWVLREVAFRKVWGALAGLA